MEGPIARLCRRVSLVKDVVIHRIVNLQLTNMYDPTGHISEIKSHNFTAHTGRLCPCLDVPTVVSGGLQSSHVCGAQSWGHTEPIFVYLTLLIML